MFQYYCKLNDDNAHLTEFAYWWVKLFTWVAQILDPLILPKISGFADFYKF